MPAPLVIGVDLGGTKVLAGAVDETLGVHHRTRRAVAGMTDATTVLAVLLDAIAEVRRAAGGEVAAVGVGLPSLIDRRTGIAVSTVHLPLRDVAAEDVLSERLGLPVVVENDANCAVLAEARHGAGRGAGRVAMLTLGTGIGGGLVLEGRLETGALGSGAEFGHMVVDQDGLPCHGNCPNRGCLETVASGTALAREARNLAAERPDSALAAAARGGRPIVGPLVTELAHDGDGAAREAIDRVATALGVGLANLTNMLNPDVIVVGGGVIGAGEMLLAPARRELLARALSPSRDHVRVLAARFGEEAGMLGAALLARERLG